MTTSSILSAPTGSVLYDWFHIDSAVIGWARDIAGAGLVTPGIAEALVGYSWPGEEHSAEWRWVYTAFSYDLNVFKIGITEDPERRMRTLRLDGRGGAFSLVSATPYCHLRHERRLCRLLEPFRFVGKTEWFHLNTVTLRLAWHLAAQRESQEDDTETRRLEYARSRRPERKAA